MADFAHARIARDTSQDAEKARHDDDGEALGIHLGGSAFTKAEPAKVANQFFIDDGRIVEGVPEIVGTTDIEGEKLGIQSGIAHAAEFIDQDVDETPQKVAQLRVALDQEPQPLSTPAIDSTRQLQHHVIFHREVEVEGPPGDTRLLGNSIDLGASETNVSKFPQSRLEDALSGLCALTGSRVYDSGLGIESGDLRRSLAR
jgi:hypothetical protein